MLNVNRIFIFLLTGIFSSSLYAINISNFDIKSLNLGKTYNQIKSKMPCNFKLDTQTAYKYTYKWQLTCDENNDLLVVHLAHGGKVKYISRKKTFTTKVNFNKIRKKLFEKYGEPTLKGYQKFHEDGGFKYSFCWGSCTKEYINNKYWQGYSAKSDSSGDKSFEIIYSYFLDVNKMVFSLSDHASSWKDNRWIDKQWDKKVEDERKKESDIDL